MLLGEARAWGCELERTSGGHAPQLGASPCQRISSDTGENDVTIILKPIPGAKRWQHLQRQQGPAGGEHLAVEQNYTIILGSHRNSKLKIEKNGDEQASATGLAGCTVDARSFTTCWINYSNGSIAIGTGPAGSSLSFIWRDPQQPIPGIRHIGLSCWDKHVSYRNVQLLPPLAAAQLQQLAEQQRQEQARLLQLQQEARLQEQQQQRQAEQSDASMGDSSAQCSPAAAKSAPTQLQSCVVPSLLQLVMESVARSMAPAGVCHVLQLSELLLPRTQQLYEAAVQLAGGWFGLLVRQHLDDLACLSVDVMADILHEPLLDVFELEVFQAVAAWCQYGSQPTADAAQQQQPEEQPQQEQQQRHPQQQQQAEEQPQQQAQQQQQHCEDVAPCICPAGQLDAAGSLPGRPPGDVQELLQLVRFAFMPEADRQAVLAHPFACSCSYVQRCMQEDLQRMSDAHEAASPRGCYTFEQRRLVRPGLSSTNASAAAAACAAGGEKAASLQPAAAAAPGSRAGGWRHFRRRLAPSCKELMYVCDGDRNGVVHYIGTDYGSKQWVNPVASKALDIKASSPPSRYTDPKALVSGQFLNTSFAGPRYIRTPQQPAAAGASAAAAAATPSTWWQLDLGPQHRLLCNYYTIRHDGSQDGFVRSWVLQGSNDLQHWLDLRRHVSDATIRLPGQYGSWPIGGPAASMPFRAFRLLLLGPTQSHASPWAFPLSHWELYGYFYKLGTSAAAAEAQTAS